MSKKFIIEELPDRYRLLNVLYQGENWNFDWFKKLLDNGAEHHLEDWIKITKNSEVKIPNSRMVHANITTLYNNRNNPKTAQKELLEEVVKDIFRRNIRENSGLTSSRIIYEPQAPDTVIHNFGYENQFSIQQDMISRAWEIKENSHWLALPINALVGTTNVSEVFQIYNWLYKKPCIYLLNQRVKDQCFVDVVMGIYDTDKFLILANNDMSSYNARGVVAIKARK